MSQTRSFFCNNRLRSYLTVRSKCRNHDMLREGCHLRSRGGAYPPRRCARCCGDAGWRRQRRHCRECLCIAKLPVNCHEKSLFTEKGAQAEATGTKREIGSAVALPMADTPANGFMKQQKRSGWNRASVRRAEAVWPDNEANVLLP